MAEFIVRDLVKEFPVAGRAPLKILNGLNLEMSRGDNLAVLGPSGCGKSTFLQIAGTLEPPTSGEIVLAGQNPFQLSPRELAHFRNTQVGFVFQEHHLLPQLTALENVLLPQLAAGSITAAAGQRAEQLLADVGLADRLHHRPGELSGGERQRVAVARALICQPVLLLADEPTGSLDEQNAQAVGKLLLEVQAAKQTILICVTHSEELARHFQRRVRLSGGQFQ